MGWGILKSSFFPPRPKERKHKTSLRQRPMAVCQNLCIFFRVSFAGQKKKELNVVFAVCPRVRGIALCVRLLFVFYYYYFFISYRLSFRLLSPSRSVSGFSDNPSAPNAMGSCRTGRSSSSVDDSTCTRYQMLSTLHETGVFRCINRKRYSFCKKTKKKHFAVYSNRGNT